jgi:hypothetical protein
VSKVPASDDALERAQRAEAALRDIRDREWVENTLDPQWAARIAEAALESAPALWLSEEMACEMDGCANVTREPTNHPVDGVPVCPSCACRLSYELGLIAGAVKGC